MGQKLEYWYKTSSSSYFIKRVQVSKFSDNSVWIYCPPLFDDQEGISKRMARNSYYEQYWPTLNEAVDFVVTRAKEKIESVREELDELEKVIKDGPKCFADPEYKPQPASMQGEILV